MHTLHNTVCFVLMMWIVVGDLQQYSCEFGSNKYFALCGFGGILSCGTTHTAVVPLDLVKCRIQVDPGKYGGIVKGFRVSPVSYTHLTLPTKRIV